MAQVGTARPAEQGVRAWVRARPIVTFFVLAYVLAWSYWFTLIAIDVDVRPGGASHLPGLAAPMLSAIIVTALADGRLGMRDLGARMMRWRTQPRWYLAALTPLLFFALFATVLAIAGEGWPARGDFGRTNGAPLVGAFGVWVLIFAVNSYGEETGWRGFALQRLQKTRSPLRSAIIIAALWAPWHIPAFFLLPDYQDLGWAIPGFFLGIFAGSVLLTRLYNGSGSSIPIVVLWHANYNFVVASEAGQGMLAFLVSALVMVWGVSLVVDEVRAKRSGHPAGPMSGHRIGPPDSVNALVRFLLHSKLHGFLSGSVTLVTVHGRKTGHDHTFPVQYAEAAGRLVVIPGHPFEKVWWRNLLGGAPLRLLLRGRDVDARGEVLIGIDQPDVVGDLLAVWLTRFPQAAGPMRVHRRPDGTWETVDLCRAAEGLVAVVVTPSGAALEGVA
jgi:membrane protease YdiL (CAAX protease family)